MYAIIQNKNIIGFMLNKPDLGSFDELVEFEGYNSEKKYIFQDGKIIEDENFENETKKIKIFEIKSNTQKNILEKYSQTDQANMSARVVEINTLAKLEGNRDFTKEEMQDIANAQNMFQWIKEQRTLCEEEIKAI